MPSMIGHVRLSKVLVGRRSGKPVKIAVPTVDMARDRKVMAE